MFECYKSDTAGEELFTDCIGAPHLEFVYKHRDVE